MSSSQQQHLYGKEGDTDFRKSAHDSKDIQKNNPNVNTEKRAHVAHMRAKSAYFKYVI